MKTSKESSFPLSTLMMKHFGVGKKFEAPIILNLFDQILWGYLRVIVTFH